MKIWEGEALVADTGDIRDSSQTSLKGGRLGVYCDSQEDITWSALSYRSVQTSVQRIILSYYFRCA